MQILPPFFPFSLGEINLVVSRSLIICYKRARLKGLPYYAISLYSSEYVDALPQLKSSLERPSNRELLVLSNLTVKLSNCCHKILKAKSNKIISRDQATKKYCSHMHQLLVHIQLHLESSPNLKIAYLLNMRLYFVSFLSFLFFFAPASNFFESFETQMCIIPIANSITMIQIVDHLVQSSKHIV